MYLTARKLGKDGVLEGPLVVAAQRNDGATASGVGCLHRVRERARSLFLITTPELLNRLAWGSNRTHEVKALVTIFSLVS